MSGRDVYRELRSRLDVLAMAKAEGLNIKGRNFDCPACQRRLKAQSRDRRGWYCVGCEERGDSVDIIAHVRGVSARDALAAARALAGVEDTSWTVTPYRAPEPAVAALRPQEAHLRARALRLAALHYTYLAGWARCEDTPSPPEHLAYLRDVCGVSVAKARLASESGERIRAYGRARVAGIERRPRVAELVGIAPMPCSGLGEYLANMGGVELCEGAVRAGLLKSDGREVLAGRLVYLWTSANGSTAYLVGRAVPGCCHGDAPKALGLPIHGKGNRPTVGVANPGVPFGLSLALWLSSMRPDLPVFVTEGELDALALAGFGWPAVATGGTGRAKPEELAEALTGRLIRVAFDYGEGDPRKQSTTDERAERLASSLCGRGLDAAFIPSAALRRAVSQAGCAA